MSAFPLDDARSGTNGSTAATNKVCNLPANVGAGPLLILILRSAGADTHSLPSGWAGFLVQNNASDGSDDTTSILYKFADGSEGTTVTVNGTASLKFAAMCWRFRAAGLPQISAAATGTSTAPNPPDFTPSGGALDWLWVWVGGWEGEQTSPPASTPTNYVNPVGANSGTAGATATNCRVAGATRPLNAASENPPTWTISVSDDWTAWTIAIPPAAGVVFTDDFDRADGALGANWDDGYSGVGSLTIAGNEIRPNAVNAVGAESVNIAHPANQFAEIRIVTITGAQLQEQIINLRMAAPATNTVYRCHAFINEGSATSRISRIIAGSATTLISENATTWVAGDILRGEVFGDRLRLYRNGALILETTDTNIASGRVGFSDFVATGGSAANCEADNFASGELAAIAAKALNHLHKLANA